MADDPETSVQPGTTMGRRMVSLRPETVKTRRRKGARVSETVEWAFADP
ncbi:MAG: hypothetical protein KGN33_05315 [Paracoccaceae bacterium]|nr:hypothetical protein [Paracoccaceae bacterium]